MKNKKPIKKKKTKKIAKALDFIREWYMIDGDHHKNWTVVEAVKILCGTEEKYQEFVNSFDCNGDGNEPDSEDSEIYNSWKEMVDENCIPP